jgi:hypothetical protein
MLSGLRRTFRSITRSTRTRGKTTIAAGHVAIIYDERCFSRELNECRLSGVFPFESSPARFSIRRACSRYFAAISFSWSDTDRYPPNFANSAHLRDKILNRATVAIASCWHFVKAIVVPITHSLAGRLGELSIAFLRQTGSHPLSARP